MSVEIHDTKDKIIGIIAEKLNMPASTIQTTSTLQDLGADSLDMVEIIMKIEEEFGVEISDERAEQLHNVQDVIDYVHSLRANKEK